MKYIIFLFCALFFSISAFAKTIVIALPNHVLSQSKEESTKQYQNFKQALEEKTHWNVKIKLYNNFSTIKKMIGNQKLDVILSPTYLYLLAKKCRIPYQVIATTLMWNSEKKKSAPYHSIYIITKKGYKNINSIYDLKNTNFGFVGHVYSGEYTYILRYFKQKKINYRQFFNSYQSLGSFHALLTAISTGKIKAGAVCTKCFNHQKSSLFKIIATIPNIPTPIFIANKQLSKKDRLTLQKALLSLPTAVYTSLPFSGIVKAKLDKYIIDNRHITERECREGFREQHAFKRYRSLAQAHRA